MTVRYTPEAIHDLQALRDYIGKILGNPKAASRIAKLILDTCGQLKNHPQLGASVERSRATALLKIRYRKR